MPSHKPVKTYEKRTRLQLSNSSKSVDAINALFAQNLTKRLKSRRKAKLKLKELPPRTETYLTDESLNVEPNNTFDKLLKGKVYNKVKVGNVAKVNSSESESSKSKLKISVSYHSPVMTRRRKKSSVVISEIKDESKMSKSSTLDKPVTSNLSIEKENKALSMSSLSYIKLPKITENQILNNNEESYQPIFSETFRERQAIHSSTPCVIAPSKKIVADPISPITKSDSSNSSQLIEKSYDQIRKWDKIFPNLEETPKKRTLGRRRKLSQEDWKLKCSPKVYLKSSDIIGAPKTKSKKKHAGDLSPDFKGFIEEEQMSSSKESTQFQSVLDSFSSFEYTQLKSKGLPTLKCNQRKRSLKRDSRRKNNFKKSDQNSIEAKKVLKNKRYSKGGHSLDPPKKVKMKPDEKTLKRSKMTLRKPQTNKISVSPVKRLARTLQVKLTPVRVSMRPVQGKATNSITSPKSSKKNLPIRRKTTNLQKSSRVSPIKSIKNEGTQCYITLRRREKSSNRISKTKKIDTSKSIKSETEKSLCINVTEDILSEKEVSYSHSSFDSSLESSKSKISYEEEVQNNQFSIAEKETYFESSKSSPKLSIAEKEMSSFDSSKSSPKMSNAPEKESSFDCSSESSRSKISYTTQELEQEKEISLPKIIEKTSDRMTVDLCDFDNFMKSYYVEEEKEVPALSIITLSDDDDDNDDYIVRPTIKEEKSSSFETSLKEDLIETSQNRMRNSLEISNLSSTLSRTPQNSKIIILSNISLGFNKNLADLNDSLKCIQHDHSYSSPPKKVACQSSIEAVEEVPLWTKQDSPLSDIIESSFLPELDGGFVNKIDRKFKRKSLKLKPGKSYRRSLSLLKRSSVIVDSGICQSDCVCLKCLFRSKLNPDVSTRTTQIVPIWENSMSKSILESYARSSTGYVRREEEEDNLDESVRNLSLINERRSILQRSIQEVPVTAKDVVLRRCGQAEVLPFEECYPRSALQNCQKIGEGVYGEVFLYRNQNGGTSVMKIIPIEGDLIVNGERQKKFDEILSEIVIAMELSNLRSNKKNTTTNFSEVQKVRCTRGNYPDRLIDLWDLYDETKGSENDSPQMFPSNQTYIVLELANGGRDLESFVFNNAMQAFAMFKQTACALAVAEHQLKFEHRDLHWGNILLTSVERDKTLQFRLEGKEIQVESLGVEVSIIDFTLSRIEFEGVVIFNDLSLDNELFVAEGDYQFEIYKAMQKSNGNEWQHFEPYTNILWLHYVLDKAVSSALRYKNTRTKIHKEYLSKLKKYKDEILSYNSVVEFVTDKFF